MPGTDRNATLATPAGRLALTGSGDAPAGVRRAVGSAGLLLLAGLGALTALGAARLALSCLPSLLGTAPGDPAAALLCLVWAAVTVLAGWLALGVLVCLLAAAPGALGRLGRRTARRTTPAALRRLASAALGGALLVGGVAPVTALAAGGPAVDRGGSSTAVPVATPPRTGTDALPGPRTWEARVADSRLSPDLVPPTPSPTPSAVPSPASSVGPATGTPASGTPTTATTTTPTATTPTPAPDPSESVPSASPRPPTSLGALAPATPRDTRPGDEPVVVTTGDCLWGIAAAHLPAPADAASVARATAAWYATNRAVVGPDPDHIEPGQVLRAPDQAGGR